MKVHLQSCRLNEDKHGNLWLATSELQRNNIYLPIAFDLVEIDTDAGVPVYYENLGYSQKRDAFWVRLIDPETEIESLEKGVEDYLANLGTSDS